MSVNICDASDLHNGSKEFDYQMNNSASTGFGNHVAVMFRMEAGERMRSGERKMSGFTVKCGRNGRVAEQAGAVPEMVAVMFRMEAGERMRSGERMMSGFTVELIPEGASAVMPEVQDTGVNNRRWILAGKCKPSLTGLHRPVKSRTSPAFSRSLRVKKASMPALEEKTIRDVVMDSRSFIITNIGKPCGKDPNDSDIAVTCGPSNINLSIQACPAAFANFDPELLALNGRHNDSRCLGVLDTSGSTPVIRYMLPVSDMPERTCGSRIHIIDAPGTGEFMDYSKVQSLLFTGFVDTPSLSGGSLISYSTNLYFNFSCLYPMQYLLKNSPLMTSFGAVAVNSNNGSFLSTLSMTLFIDASFTTPLNLNGTAYALRTKMYVQVAATNLTSNFSVLLDQCFATPSPLVTTASDRYNLFAGCDQQNKTNIIKNGVGILAQFSFEAFRFVAHSGQKSSTSYLHCVTRLCQPDQCLQYLQACNNGAPSLRKKRASSTSAQGTTDPVMVSSGPLSIKDTALEPRSSNYQGGPLGDQKERPKEPGVSLDTPIHNRRGEHADPALMGEADYFSTWTGERKNIPIS
ncbi:zona pellucida-like domain-containing protein 1 [Ambystoma mexicanum]|uniref:zona pellucida-like domain-containing protein 1 n=1 Tax=Ambystoma mexicanum TaxID=8296 RepID=UPI0037E7E0B8